MSYHLGIDAGSKTIKVLVLDENDEIVHVSYTRHRFDIKTMLIQAIHELNWRFGKIDASVCVTGSAGIGVAQACDLPFVQEVVSTTVAVQQLFPQADAVIELGGEDAKVIYLTGGLEQRMNATCAGGTGGFIDNIAYMLGIKTSQVGSLSLGSTRTYPIASRCAVFAQTDIRPLMSAGASITDLCASTLDAVVRQVIGGLACGRPIEGNVVYLGGPFRYVPQLAHMFTKALNLQPRQGILPKEPHIVTVQGAAIYGKQLDNPVIINTGELEERLKEANFEDGSLPHLEPLFESEDEIEEFQSEHDIGLPRARLFDASGQLYLGIDAGSTTVKIAILDENETLLYSDYKENEGEVLNTAVDMLKQAYGQFPKTYKGDYLAYFAHAVATGYGEDLLIKALGVDSGVVETSAHVAAALHFDPQLSFMLDIGGQDMKAVWVRDGVVENAVLNEACSSGCGAFLSGTAWGLRLPLSSFSKAAMRAKSPIDLGTKCTVFMNSRMKHAQKTGANKEDLAAGSVYSVVKNALFRIIGINNIDSLGDHIVVQGGTFKNDAVLRAFEKISGKGAMRPNQAHLMGAIGAALIAKRRAHAKMSEAVKANTQELPHSTLLTRAQLDEFKVNRKLHRCTGCGNACMLTLLDFGMGRRFINGNKCSRAYSLVDFDANESLGINYEQLAPNVIAYERSLIESYKTHTQDGELGKVHVGFIPALTSYANIPFWHTLLATCGFSVVMPKTESSLSLQSEAASTVPSESVCMCAKLSHTHLFSVEAQGATVAFMPQYDRGAHCAVSASYANALKDGASLKSKLAATMISPLLFVSKPSLFVQDPQSISAVYESFVQLAKTAGTNAELSREKFNAAFERALNAQAEFIKKVCEKNEEAIAWVNETNARGIQTRHGVVLTGRPYHVDKNLSHSIDEVLSSLGVAVLSPTGVPKRKRSLAQMHANPRKFDHWAPAAHYIRLAEYARQNPRLEVVYTYSFGCTFDVVSLDEAAAFLHNAHKPFTALKIDEITDVAHIRIRLRTLVEGLEQAEYMRKNEREESLANCSQDAREIDGHALNAKTILPDYVPPLRTFGVLDEAYVKAAREGDIYAFANMDECDVETSRVYVHDLCYTTLVTIGRALRIMEAAPELDRLAIPYICSECIFDCIPVVLARTLGRYIDVEWVHAWPENTEQDTTERSGAASASSLKHEAQERKKIGLVGTAPLVFDPYLNDNIVQVIESHGAEVVFPNAHELQVDDVRYIPVLKRFVEEGVTSVIYLQSFGCLKGHVQARGALHELKNLFPQLTITVIDYDAEASALNRENRVLLAIH